MPNARNIHNHGILRRLSEKISFYSSYASYASYASCASYAYCASENRRIFGIKAMGTNAFRRQQTPSTACGRFPSLDEGGLGLRRSRPSALPSIGFRGFAVAPKPLRAPSRRFSYNPGCRVATLLVSMGGYGVPRGFKGGSKPSAPCGRLSEAEHPKRKGATLLRPLSAVNRNLPGNSHSRASAPCDFRFPPCFFPHSGRMAPIPLIP